MLKEVFCLTENESGTPPDIGIEKWNDRHFQTRSPQQLHGMIGYAHRLYAGGNDHLFCCPESGPDGFCYYTLYRRVVLLLIPCVTMRSLCRERRTRTDQLLLTSPVSW